MLRALVLVLALAGAQAPARAPQAGPILRMNAGEARLAEGRSVRALDRRAGAVELAGEAGWLEVGAGSQVELVWRGLASATVHGPAMLELGRAPELRLEQAQVLELEVRRGTLALELAGIGTLALSAGALRLRALPDDVLELFNRGGAPLELHFESERPLRIPAGQRVRLRTREP